MHAMHVSACLFGTPIHCCADVCGGYYALAFFFLLLWRDGVVADFSDVADFGHGVRGVRVDLLVVCYFMVLWRCMHDIHVFACLLDNAIHCRADVCGGYAFSFLTLAWWCSGGFF